MATVSELREALATRCATVSGLRTSAYVPDNPRPPVAIVMLERIAYDLDARRGADRYYFTILLMVARADDRAAQNNLDKYLVGATSVKTAVEGDRTLGGKADTCRVTELREYGVVPVGDTLYLGAHFSVEVIA